jgi:signal peptidase I
MSPGIPVGSLVVDRPVDPGTLHVGDVATYQKTPGVADYITHRIVKIDASKNPTMFTFKGDANRGADLDPVPATAIRGKVWFHVPYLGAVRDAIHTKGGVAGIAAAALAGYAILQLAGAASARRRGADSPATDQPDGDRSDWAALRATNSGFTGDPLLVIATLQTTDADGLTPAEVARVLHGTVLDVADGTFTVLVAADPSRDGTTLVLAQEIAPASAVQALVSQATKLEACTVTGPEASLVG